MSTQALAQPTRDLALPWALLMGVFLLIFGPLYLEASEVLWVRDEHAHSPLILVIALWLAWQQRDRLISPPVPFEPAKGLGWGLALLGVLVFMLGRVLDFSILCFAAQPLVAAGGVLLLGGWAALRQLWFPVLFLIFMIPLPGVLVDAATGALKQWVSVIAEWLLSSVGYPVGRAGVMLVVGQYQLMVADACSGLHSMFTLTAMGMLFMHLKARPSLLHNALMLLAILPIAFVANIIRVMVLVLVTYHLGDEAGQGFLHGAAGVVLIVAALLVLVAFDRFLALFQR
jgi:exosortase B